jgi:hypothetical protein
MTWDLNDVSAHRWIPVPQVHDLPKPKPRTKTVNGKVAGTWAIPKSFITPGTPAVYTDEPM